MTGPVLDIGNVSVTYSGVARAVSGVSLTVQPGEVLGLIGESGSGKSTLAHSILGLLPPSAAIAGDRMTLAGTNILNASKRDIAALRGPAAAMVFQNPMATFSPLHTIGRQLTDFLWRDRTASRREKRARIVEALAEAGISDPEARFNAYPFELSGGMLQRVSIAAALLMKPSLLIADEPTTALDVTMEAQILHLMRELREKTGVAILMISHQLGVIAEICDRVAVMYAGRIVEEGTVQDIFANPRHPYTKALLACELSLVESGAGRLPAIRWEEGAPAAGKNAAITDDSPTSMGDAA